jgi:hypothetical protein
MTENLDLDLKKQELLNQIDQIFASNTKLEQSVQTDEDLIFNYVWNSN